MPVAVVTGGASGFGAALGARCAALGMDVVLLDRDGDRAAGVAAGLAASHGVAASGDAADVTDADGLHAVAATIDDRFGAVDLVVSNVGVQLFGAIESFTDAEWAWVLDVNVTGSARVARTFLPLLRRSDDPRLVFTTSSSVFDPASRLAAYQASKFAVWGLAESLRVELAPDGIHVAVVFPSGMATRHLETSGQVQPDHIRRPVVGADDLDVMMASNPDMAAALATADDAAAGVIEAVLAGEPYVVTHGDLVAAVADRCGRLARAAGDAAGAQSG